EAFGRWAADQIDQAIEMEGPDTVAAVFVEPVQNSGGCFPPPPGYFQRVREICDKHDVLLVSDEVICAFGRLGTIFACDKFGYVFFYGIELVKDKATKETFDEDESERLLRGFLSRALFDAGLYCRADDRGDPVVQLAPPLIVGQSEFDEMEQILRGVLSEAWTRI